MNTDTTLRTPRGSWHCWLLSAAILLLLPLTGCVDDGEKGEPGSSGMDTESGITEDTTLTRGDAVPEIDITVTEVTGGTGPGGTLQVGDQPVITFTVTKEDGSAWHLDELTSGRVFISGPTFNYQPVISSQSDLIANSVRIDEGTYQYTFSEALPATYPAPINDTDNYGADDGELQGQALLDGTYTVALVMRWYYTVNGEEMRTFGNTTADFLVGSTAVMSPREVVSNDNCNSCHEQLQAHGGNYQDTRLCVLCHTSGAEDSSGAGPMIDFRVMIHKIHNAAHLPSVLGVTTNADGDRDYSATPVPYQLTTRRSGAIDFSHVHFPVFPSFTAEMPRDAGYTSLAGSAQDQEDAMLSGIVACYKCHGDPDGSGPLQAPSQGSHAYAQPTRRACGSCHDDIVWEHPYVANGMTMPAQTGDGSCIECHAGSGNTLADGIAVTGGTVKATPFAHAHPMDDPAKVPGAETYHNGVNFTITGVSGSAADYFVAGEKPAITFTITDEDGNALSLHQFDRLATTLVGPSENRHAVLPMAGPHDISIPIIDVAGRLKSTSSSGKGDMSRVVGSTASETLRVTFTSATAFDVTAGSGLTALGSGTLPAATSSNPSRSSLEAIELTTSAVAQTITVSFTSATAFTVTGSVSGAMGSGTLPAETGASTRFTADDGSLAFTVESGSTAFAAGNEFAIGVFVASANGHRFAIVAGGTAFAAGDRFYYDTADNTATSYTFNIPMDIPLEFLGDGSGTAAQTVTAGNLPVYWGHETIYERTAISGGSSTLAQDVAASARFIELADASGFAADDHVVLDDGGGTEEYLQIGSVIGNQLWFKTQVRYAHAAGTTCQGVTLSRLQESADYTLDPSTGVITTVNAITVGNALVASYRSAGAFGWYRHAGDTRQDVYPAPINDSPDLGQESGEWQGLAFQDGTYTAAIWGEVPIYVSEYGEAQVYHLPTTTASGNFRYGSAGSVEPYDYIAFDDSTCASCHEDIIFHGGHRKGTENCLVCHGTAGMEDWPAYASGDTSWSTPGVTATFRTMIHKIHMGEDLANASTYTVKGFRGRGHSYESVVFPVMPGKTKACDQCHGEDNDAWKAPADRIHPDQTTPTRSWTAVCSSCHDSTATQTHIDAMTTGSGQESCQTCHAAGKEAGVDNVHKNR